MGTDAHASETDFRAKRPRPHLRRRMARPPPPRLLRDQPPPPPPGTYSVRLCAGWEAVGKRVTFSVDCRVYPPVPVALL